MYWDTHIHCSFSGDSDSPPEAMVMAAVSKGLSGICFTDHLDYDYPEDPELFLLDLPAYVRSMKQLARQFADQLPVCHGIELGLQPHLAGKHRQLLQNYEFDFVIGSSHVVHGKDPYFRQYYDGRTCTQAWQEYFISILENIQAFHDFDVYGHLDYVVRYHPEKNRYSDYREHLEIIDEILKLLIRLGKGIELNTAGYKYGLGHPNPCEDILKRYRALGGEIITTGSDAHKPEHMAYCFDRLGSLLKSCGFSHYTVFRNRKPEFIPL